MTDTTTTTATDAAELAHTYYLYRDALGAPNRMPNYAGITIYGDWLLSMQTRMGVELIAPAAIRAAIATADQMLDELLEA